MNALPANPHYYAQDLLLCSLSVRQETRRDMLHTHNAREIDEIIKATFENRIQTLTKLEHEAEKTIKNENIFNIAHDSLLAAVLAGTMIAIFFPPWWLSLVGMGTFILVLFIGLSVLNCMGSSFDKGLRRRCASHDIRFSTWIAELSYHENETDRTTLTRRAKELLSNIQGRIANLKTFQKYLENPHFYQFLTTELNKLPANQRGVSYYWPSQAINVIKNRCEFSMRVFEVVDVVSRGECSTTGTFFEGQIMQHLNYYDSP